jgi:hypothetical protein
LYLIAGKQKSGFVSIAMKKIRFGGVVGNARQLLGFQPEKKKGMEPSPTIREMNEYQKSKGKENEMKSYRLISLLLLYECKTSKFNPLSTNSKMLGPPLSNDHQSRGQTRVQSLDKAGR